MDMTFFILGLGLLTGGLIGWLFGWSLGLEKGRSIGIMDAHRAIRHQDKNRVLGA